MSLADFDIIKHLGKGAFASVCLVKRKNDSKTYAMKRVNFSNMGSKEKDNALNEIRILASIRHINIIGYKESFYDEQSKTLNIIMEFADEGDLDGKLKKHSQTRTNFPENLIWKYLIQILQGLKALHEQKIMHRDLKSANIFIKQGVIKLGDLNVSKLIKKLGMDHTQTGTPYYASPEVWSDKPYDYKCDIWSVGCIIYELCALKPPFRANSLEDLFKAITKGKFDPIPSIYSRELHMVIGMLLQVNPSLRPDVNSLLRNSLIVKKMDYSSEIGSIVNEGGNNMLKTIKAPKNLKDINQQLPKQKGYDIGEVIVEKERKNSEENKVRDMNNRPKIIDNRSNNNPYSNIGNNQPQYKIGNVPDNKLNPVINNINKGVQGLGINNNGNRPITGNNNGNGNGINRPVSGVSNNNRPGMNNINNNVSNNRDINKVQDQRNDLLKKYNQNPYSNIGSNNNVPVSKNVNDPRNIYNRGNQDVRIRPRTPDAVSKNNVIMKNNQNIMPKNNYNINNYNNNKININNPSQINRNPVPINNPNQVINRNPVPINNPYIIKRYYFIYYLNYFLIVKLIEITLLIE